MKKALLFSFVLVLALLTQAWAQNRTVTGRVTDPSTGEGMPGVTVQLKGTSTAVPTDVNGSYSISVPATGGTLVYSFVGYTNQEIAIGSQSTINVRLAGDAEALNEVVVTGYGAPQERREVTGAISSIKGEAIEGLPTQTFDKAMQGRLAGVQVTSQSGQPGGGITVQIRGAATINGSTQPLYVIDGIQVSPGGLSGQTSANVLSSINPADIESIEVLKDAASASIYGSQAANGVVIITTKRGKAGKTKVRVAAQYGVNEMYNPYDVVDANEYYMLKQEAYVNQYLRTGRTREAALAAAAAATFPGGVVPNPIPSTDWYDAITQKGKVQQYELSASGGDEKTRFFISGSFNKTEGTIIQSNFTRGTVRANIDHKLSNKFSIETTLGLTGSKSVGPGTNAGFFTNTPFTGALYTPPFNQVYNEDGTFNTNIRNAFNVNLVQSLYEEDRESAIAQTVSNMAINYDILPGLRFRAFGGIDFSDAKDRNYRPTSIPIYAPTGTANETFNRRMNWTTSYTLNFNKKINEVHNVGALAGFEYRQVDNTALNAGGSGFASPLFRLLSSAATPTAVGSTFSGRKIASFFGNFKYDYKSKYLASATLRYDGSSRFGADNKWGLFYGLSAGWRISAEDFMQGAGFINDLKIRASYGQVGSQPEGDFTSLGLYGNGGQYNDQPGIRPTQLANTDFGWETSKQIDLGLDFALFNNRVTGSIDIYRKNTTDLILARELPGDAFPAGIQENGGEVEAKGLDFDITTVNVDAGGFRWTTTFNIGFTENKLKSLNVGERIGNTYVVGEPLYLIYTYKWAGVNPADGRPMYYDANGNITYSPVNADQDFIGDQNADFFGGAGTTLSYKGLSLDALFQYQYGNMAFVQTAQILETSGSTNGNQIESQLDRWTTPGQITSVPRPYQGLLEPGGYNHNNFSSRFAEEASYIRLKQVTLNYRLPSALSQKFHVPGVSLFVQGLNLLTFTNFRGDDPETTGQNLNAYPNPRTLTGGITLEF